VREALRAEGVSEDARDALALRAVAPLAALPAEAPELVLLAVARLAARGLLAGPALAGAAALALRGLGALEGIRTEELRPLWRALGTDREVEPERRTEGLAALVRSAGTSRGVRRGAELISAIARDATLTDDLRKRVLECIVDGDRSSINPGKTTPGMRRRAYRHLAEMADERWRAAARLATEGREAGDFDRWRAAADAFGEHGASAPGERVRDLVRDGLHAPEAAVRQAWYRTGVKLLGGDVRDWAPDDVLHRAESRRLRGDAGGGGDPAQTSLF